MNRRTFMQMGAVVGLVQKPSIAIDEALNYLSTPDYEFIYSDWDSRFPLEADALRRHSWMIDDLRWCGEDGNFPGHRQQTQAEELAYEQKYGRKPSYWWRQFLPLAKDLLRGVPPFDCTYIAYVEGVTIYQALDYEELDAIRMFYVFHARRSVARVEWNRGASRSERCLNIPYERLEKRANG